MPEIPVDYGQAQATIQLSGDLEPMTVGMGFQCTAGHLFTQANADSFSGFFLIWLRSNMATAYTCTTTEFVYGQVGGDVAFSSVSGAGLGTLGSSAAPQNVAMLVQKRSGLTGRKNRGRCYIPGITEAIVDDTGGITTTPLAAANVRANAFMEDIEFLGDFEGLSILHSLGDAALPARVTSLTVDRVVATQRRRLRR